MHFLTMQPPWVYRVRMGIGTHCDRSESPQISQSVILAFPISDIHARSGSGSLFEWAHHGHKNQDPVLLFRVKTIPTWRDNQEKLIGDSTNQSQKTSYIQQIRLMEGRDLILKRDSWTVRTCTEVYKNYNDINNNICVGVKRTRLNISARYRSATRDSVTIHY